MNKLTITIPTLGAPHLIDCLKSIFENVKPEEEFDIIIVKNDRKGFTVPVNRGMKLAAKDSHVLIMNDDTIVKEPFIEKLFKPLETNSNIGMVTNQMWGYGFGNNPNLWRSSFAFVMVTRPAIDKIGFLDEQFKYFAQDLDYCYRLDNIAGFKQVEVPINVEHLALQTFGKTFKDSAEIQRQDNNRFREKFFK